MMKKKVIKKDCACEVCILKRKCDDCKINGHFKEIKLILTRNYEK